MAIKNILVALRNYPLAHLPTLVLIIGTLLFWVELYIIRLPLGHTSWLAWGIAALCLVLMLIGRDWSFRQAQKSWFNDEPRIFKILFAIGALGALIYLAVGFYASLLPPHLVQESDALVYHLTLPRQHLLRHSFAHLPWSVEDLFLLPLDYALSPFALATVWPNKCIQFAFLAGCLGCAFHLAYQFSGQSYRRAWLAMLAVMSCHAVAIQAGLAMLDLVMLYCFLASIHSNLTGRWALSGIEMAFFMWSKPFIPFQMAVVGIAMVLVIGLTLKNGFSCQELALGNSGERKAWLRTFALVSLVIAVPYLVKSYYYTGTPFYPFGIGIFPPLLLPAVAHWHAIVQKAGECLAVRNGYGHGRSVMTFIKHFWLLAVPEKGVNNAFDYPLGLVYLLCLPPFLVHTFMSLKSRRLPILSLMVIIGWMTWWFGSQQSRFLLVPVCLMIILTVSYFPYLSRLFVVLVIMGLGLESISVINTHRHDWNKPSVDVLREQDRELLQLKPPAGQIVELDRPDVAFASFPVNVRGPDSIHVINNF